MTLIISYRAMKKLLITFSIITLISVALPTKAQNVGLSFSFFFPKNGEFSTPISPFSFRGVGVSFNEYVGIETGFTLYRMTGMGVTDLPFETDKSIVGPNFTLLVPLELVLTGAFGPVELSAKAGGFGVLPFDNKIKHGNLDRAIATANNYELVNSEYEGSASLGFGYHFGGEMIVYATQSFGISLEGNYFIGGADFEMTGSYQAVENGNVITVDGPDANFSDARIDMSGFEISIGVILTPGGGGRAAPRRRRR